MIRFLFHLWICLREIYKCEQIQRSTEINIRKVIIFFYYYIYDQQSPSCQAFTFFLCFAYTFTSFLFFFFTFFSFFFFSNIKYLVLILTFFFAYPKLPRPYYFAWLPWIHCICSRCNLKRRLFVSNILRAHRSLLLCGAKAISYIPFLLLLVGWFACQLKNRKSHCKKININMESHDKPKK